MLLRVFLLEQKSFERIKKKFTQTKKVDETSFVSLSLPKIDKNFFFLFVGAQKKYITKLHDLFLLALFLARKCE